MAKHIHWFPLVSADRTRWPEAKEWFLVQWKQGMDFADISGSLMLANQSQSGLMSYYDALHTDLDCILKVFEQDMRIIKAMALRRMADNPPTKTKLNATELKSLIEAESEVVDAEMVVIDVRYVYNLMGSVLKGLDQRGYRLGDISKLRVAGMQEVEV